MLGQTRRQEDAACSEEHESTDSHRRALQCHCKHRAGRCRLGNKWSLNDGALGSRSFELRIQCSSPIREQPYP
jgi:hypothetical protein